MNAGVGNVANLHAFGVSVDTAKAIAAAIGATHCFAGVGHRGAQARAPAATHNDTSTLQKAAGVGNLSLTETSIWRIPAYESGKVVLGPIQKVIDVRSAADSNVGMAGDADPAVRGR